jgi:uncharacterized protein with HEPN domain
MRSENAAERRWLLDIRFHIVLAQCFVAGQTFDSFRDDLMRLYAVTRCLEIISEASRRVSAKVKERHPAIPWRAIGAAGNVYRHDYEDVAANVIWRTLHHDLPPLLAVMEQELGG